MKMEQYGFLIFVFLTTVLTIVKCDDLATYTVEEKILIKQLHARLVNDLTQPIMHDNAYLVRFLRAQEHDLDKAEVMMRENLAWRNETNMDKIMDEDWSPWVEKYPFSIHMHDAEGRPALTSSIGQIDARNLILKGQKDMLDRFMVYIYERGLYNVKHASIRTGKEFIDGYLLFNMAGYGVRTHACLACIPTWIKLVDYYERFYPQLCRSIIAINTPKIFKRVFDIIKPLMTAHTSQIVRLYDFDKDNWKQELLKIIPKDVLIPEFGGKGKVIQATVQSQKELENWIH